MIGTLPSKNLSLLKSLLGKKITSVKRQLLKGDMVLSDFEQNADGPVQFLVNNDTTLHFIAETEMFSIGVVFGEIPRYGECYAQLDVSNNTFWCDRVGQKMTQLTLLKASDWSENYPSEFGIEILFNNGKRVFLEYIDDEKHPDMIRVANDYTGKPCINEFIK